MASWLRRWTRRSPGPTLGPLELRVLEELWGRETPTSVRDLTSRFPDTAYTTLMTTLDRLHRKGLLERRKAGRAFYYRPRWTRAELDSADAAEAIRAALDCDGATLRPLLSFFVDAVGERDHRLLGELEALVRARRQDRERKGS